jgi:uncharacterized protein (DUF1778 family)
MAKKRPASKHKTGGGRMKELGYMPIQVWCDREDMALLKEAADQDERPLTRFVLKAALEKAKELLARVKRPGK